MIGVTIGTGDWAALAHLAASRMTAMTGLQCFVLPEELAMGYVHPSWAKSRAIEWAKDDVLLFDADIYCMKEWNPEALLGDADIACVPEEPNTINGPEAKLYGLPMERYVNAGMLIMRQRAGADLMKQMVSYHPHYGRWWEQTAANKELLKLGNRVRHLPRAYNDLIRSGTKITTQQLKERHSVNLHFAGPKNLPNLLATYASL